MNVASIDGPSLGYWNPVAAQNPESKNKFWCPCSARHQRDFETLARGKTITRNGC